MPHCRKAPSLPQQPNGSRRLGRTLLTEGALDKLLLPGELTQSGFSRITGHKPFTLSCMLLLMKAGYLTVTISWHEHCFKSVHFVHGLVLHIIYLSVNKASEKSADEERQEGKR